MSDKHASKTDSIEFSEGTEVKGGINPRPSTPRPSQPPKGQGPKKASGSK